MAEILEKKLSWQEFRNLEFDDAEHFIYELINGMAIKRTSPSLAHQRVSRRLTFLLEKFLSDQPLGEFFTAPTDIALDDYNGVVPDLAFVSSERSFILEREDSVDGVPDLIFEIISPGSVRRDRLDKKDLYERFGVKEYWLLDPGNKAVEIYVLRDNAYTLHQFLEETGIATSMVLPGFECDISALFQV